MKEVHVPSKLQRASQRHSVPFSPSSNKANNVKLVVQVVMYKYIFYFMPFSKGPLPKLFVFYSNPIIVLKI